MSSVQSRTSALVAFVVVVAALVLLPRAQGQMGAIEDYADYEPQRRCRTTVGPGTLEVGEWLTNQFGARGIGYLRGCDVGGTSEHKDGRALDWPLDATNRNDRLLARTMLKRLFREDARGNTHARARRMGIMYVIWNDHIYASYNDFERREYLPRSCQDRPARCSTTVRHRDHMHISLSKDGARGETSWQIRRFEREQR